MKSKTIRSFKSFVFEFQSMWHFIHLFDEKPFSVHPRFKTCLMITYQNQARKVWSEPTRFRATPEPVFEQLDESLRVKNKWTMYIPIRTERDRAFPWSSSWNNPCQLHGTSTASNIFGKNRWLLEQDLSNDKHLLFVGNHIQSISSRNSHSKQLV